MKRFSTFLLYVVSIIFFTSTFLYTDGPGATMLFSPALATGIQGIPFSAYNSENDQFIFTWLSGANQTSYVLCSNMGTQITSQVSFPGTSTSTPSAAYNSVNNEYIVTWLSNTPTFAVVDNTGNLVIAPTSIYISPDLLLEGNTFCCYNSVNNQYCITWTAKNSISLISSTYFVIVNADGTIAQGETAIANISGKVTADFTDSFVTYNSQDNQYLFTWLSVLAPGDTAGNSAFAIYDADGNEVVSATVIPQSSFATISYPIFSCYNSTHNQYFITWCAFNSFVNNFFAIYDSNGNQIVQTTEIANLSSPTIPVCSYNSGNNQYFVSWGDNSQAIYSIFDSTGNTVQSQMDLPLRPGGQPASVVFNSYNVIDDENFITWYSSGGTCTYFNIFTTTPDLLPPSNFKATNGSNRFINFIEYITELTWTPSTSANIASYNIYKNGTLIATLPAYATSYTAHNKPTALTTYSIQTVDTFGDVSALVSITA